MDERSAWPRYELLDGELLVTPSPTWAHQMIVAAMHRIVAPYCIEQSIGVALMSPADIELAVESILQPDVFVVPEELIPTEPVQGWEHVRSLLLAVEVLSPSTQRADRVGKREFYLDHGVPDYWIIDADARVIERWTSDSTRPDIRRDVLEWQPATARSSLRIDVQQFFVRDCRLPRRL
ncbi:MAG TPA: Uma2 family endonuclease [Gemmatimonadaceae bacterium]|nr:Uma2 family endonuclease [Gemmatimonadaceae bacterium]